MSGKEVEYVADAVASTWISGGKYLNKLEDELSDILGKRVLTTSNGTTAIQLAYLVAGLKAGDEIIVPGFTFMAVANLALHVGIKPIFADVDFHTWCVTAKNIEKKLTNKTKAIVPVHTYGNVCDMDEIVKLASRNNIIVIEDGAEALFSKYKNNYCGTFGEIGTFSMHATKTITTGEGGFVVCDDSLTEVMSLYRSHGLLERGSYDHLVAGHNFRLTNIQAALGCAQLENITTILAEKNRILSVYRSRLENIDGIYLQEYRPEVDPVVWVVAVRLDDLAFPQSRDGVLKQLKAAGVEARPGFVASSKLKYFAPHKLPVSEELSRTVLSLPTYPDLKNEEIHQICDVLIEARS